MSARPYQIILTEPAALAHITGIARMCIHAARRFDKTTPATGCDLIAAEAMRLRADQIARVGLKREGIEA
jgi:hypothetical protein